MDKKILDQQIDEKVAEFILNKVSEYKARLNENYKAKQAKLFKNIDKLVESREEEIKEEYSARLATKLKEKNDYIKQLEENLEAHKEELTERVNTFLMGSKEDIRTLVEEEVRVDSETLKAQHIVDEIRNLVGNGSVNITAVDDNRISRLEEDIKVLKERLTSKTEANNKLKAQLKKYQLVESVPAGDRDFYLSQMRDISSVSEAEEVFAKIKKSIRAFRVQNFEQEMRATSRKGIIFEDKTNHSPIIPSNNLNITEKMKKLAGL